MLRENLVSVFNFAIFEGEGLVTIRVIFGSGAFSGFKIATNRTLVTEVAIFDDNVSLPLPKGFCKITKPQI